MRTAESLAKARASFAALDLAAKTEMFERLAPTYLFDSDLIAALEWHDPRGDYEDLSREDLVYLLAHARGQLSNLPARKTDPEKLHSVSVVLSLMAVDDHQAMVRTQAILGPAIADEANPLRSACITTVRYVGE